ncbi:MAG TPA: hypothetical protein VIU29_00070 [Candidatus Deferrimicrobiaceae bacterium]
MPGRRHGACALSLLLLLLFSGCPKNPGLESLPAPVEKKVAKIGDDGLRKALLINSPLPFAVVARFDSPIFPNQSEILSDAGIPPVETTGNTALLVATAVEITSMLELPSLAAIRYLGSQASLARLHPELEIGMLRTFDRRTEAEPVDLLARFRSPPEKREEDAVTAAGFGIEARSGPTWTLRGPMERIPRLLEIDEIIYLQAASKTRTK